MWKKILTQQDQHYSAHNLTGTWGTHSNVQCKQLSLFREIFVSYSWVCYVSRNMIHFRYCDKRFKLLHLIQGNKNGKVCQKWVTFKHTKRLAKYWLINLLTIFDNLANIPHVVFVCVTCYSIPSSSSQNFYINIYLKFLLLMYIILAYVDVRLGWYLLHFHLIFILKIISCPAGFVPW